jgi:hypothetical protein
MKLQIIRPEQDTIGGYEVVQITKPNSLELSHVVDNSCESILAADLMDSFGSNSVQQVCQALVSKLRLGGEVSIGGTDVRFFSKFLANGLLDVESACHIITATYSMSTSDMAVEALKSLGLEILTVHMDGLHYEVKAVRK